MHTIASQRIQVSLEGEDCRTGRDRRQEVDGAPDRRRMERRVGDHDLPSGWRDRRRSVERRMPEVVELSFETWARHRAAFGDGPAVRPAGVMQTVAEEVLEIFERIIIR